MGDRDWSRGFHYDGYGNQWVNHGDGDDGAGVYADDAVEFRRDEPVGVAGVGVRRIGESEEIGGSGFVWDAEGRMVSSRGQRATQYSYDGEGRRVMKEGAGGRRCMCTTRWGIWRRSMGGGGGSAVRDVLPDGGSAGEYAGGDGWERRGGGAARLFAVWGRDLCGDGGADGGVEVSAGDGWGGCDAEVHGEGAGRGDRGLDYFGARYFSGAQGRFTSPDAPFADQHPGDPQSGTCMRTFGTIPLRTRIRMGGIVRTASSRVAITYWVGLGQL